MLVVGLRPLSRDRPGPALEVDLAPLRTRHLAGPKRREDDQFQRRRGQRPVGTVSQARSPGLRDRLGTLGVRRALLKEAPNAWRCQAAKRPRTTGIDRRQIGSLPTTGEHGQGPVRRAAARPRHPPEALLRAVGGDGCERRHAHARVYLGAGRVFTTAWRRDRPTPQGDDRHESDHGAVDEAARTVADRHGAPHTMAARARLRVSAARARARSAAACRPRVQWRACPPLTARPSMTPASPASPVGTAGTPPGSGTARTSSPPGPDSATAPRQPGCQISLGPLPPPERPPPTCRPPRSDGCVATKPGPNGEPVMNTIVLADRFPLDGGYATTAPGLVLGLHAVTLTGLAVCSPSFGPASRQGRSRPGPAPSRRGSGGTRSS